MKNLYGKSKGKIHPDGVGGGASPQAALSVLPAAILALAAVLSAEDREVLAYLVSRSLRGPTWLAGPGAASVEDELAAPQRWRSKGGGKGSSGGGGAQQQQKQKQKDRQKQKHEFGCGCFDCYRGFWCRWDASPDRELIHQAIEAFEEHLASGEMVNRGGGRRRGARGRNRGKGPSGGVVADGDGKGEGGNGGGMINGGNNSNRKGICEKSGGVACDNTKEAEEKQAAEQVELSQHGRPVPEVSSSSSGAASPAPRVLDAAVMAMEEEKSQQDGTNEYDVEEWAPSSSSSSSTSCSLAADYYSHRRRGGWADVMGLFNSRLWSLWSPGA